MDEAAEALDLMNLQHQIQHLDVKPQNLFLVHQHIKVADFGLAKDLEGAKTNLTGGITPTYAPPETFEGWVSRQSDQYSLAIVFMEMLTGPAAVYGQQHPAADPPAHDGRAGPVALPPLDRQAVGRALSKVPDERFPTCAEFVRAIRGDETPAPPRGRRPVARAAARPPPGPERHRRAGRADPDDPAGRPRERPALVTPARSVPLDDGPELRRPASDTGSGPRTNPPTPERTGNGVLCPGPDHRRRRVGLTFVRTLRQLIADRFGKPTLPHLRGLPGHRPGRRRRRGRRPRPPPPCRPRTFCSPDSARRRTT